MTGHQWHDITSGYDTERIVVCVLCDKRRTLPLPAAPECEPGDHVYEMVRGSDGHYRIAECAFCGASGAVG